MTNVRPTSIARKVVEHSDKVKPALARVLDEFQTGNVPRTIARTLLPALDIPAARYSITNKMLVVFADTEDVRGFRVWKKVGRSVKKGAKAVYILAPNTRTKTETDANGEEFKKSWISGFRPIPVFRVEDTEGEPVDYGPPAEPPQPPPLADVAAQWGVEVAYLRLGEGGMYGYYKPGADNIGLLTHEEQVFFHELAHAAHHRVKGSMKGGQDWKQEIVAELSAAVLAELYTGKRYNGDSFAYITDHARGANLDAHTACLRVLGDVGKVLTLIVEATEQAPAIAA